MVNQIFANLPVKDLKKSMVFFTKLGFKFDKTFTDKNAACLILGKNIYAMLITHKLFSTFTKKKISDAKKQTEVLLALQVGSKKEVDSIIKKARSAGGKGYVPPMDYGWMYSNNFIDLDGHQWEVFFMNKKKMPKK